MAHINFVIPQSLRELSTEDDEQYYVRNVTGVKELSSALKTANRCFIDEGPEFILENFDVYYSVLHHADTLPMHVISTSSKTLQKAVQDLNKTISHLLSDKESLSEEQKSKALNVIKMLLYIYAHTVTLIEQKVETKNKQTLTVKGKSKKKSTEEDDDYCCDRIAVVKALSYIMQLEISYFWDPPVVDEVFINTVAEVCYRFLESTSIKQDKEARLEVWGVLGLMVKNYNHGMTFIVRLVQLIKMHEHLTGCIAEGIQHLVNTFNCKGLVRDLVREITEWQCDEKFIDTQGTRFCSHVLSDMAALMPELMIPEIMYLSKYLAHESYTLRNCVLNVMVEVVLLILTKDDLTDEQRESRDEFLLILEEHIRDTSPFVRCKVFQHWGRLQKENAVPIKMQVAILEKAVLHLRDKSANVRKNAAICVTIFLEHNLYGSNLQLGQMRDELTQKTNELNMLKAELVGIRVNKLQELEEEWNKHEAKLRETIEQELISPTQMPDGEVDQNTLPEIIRNCIASENYREAFSLCRIAGKTIPEFRDLRDKMEDTEEVDLFMVLIRTIFTNVHGQTEELVASTSNNNQHCPSEEALRNLDSQERTVDYFTDCVKFLELIDGARKPMRDLLDSASIGDMQEAVEFFVAAYRFNIDNALEDVLEMLRIMGRGEEKRRETVLDAFKTIYLMTDSKTSMEHTTLIVTRLIKLLKIVPYNNYTDMSLIISEWVSKGTLDNTVIDTLWQYFTKKIDVSDEDSRAALTLLTMASQGRRTIITRNIKLVTTIAFSERGMSDILLVTQALRLLSTAGAKKQDIKDKNPPFKIKANDTIWKELCDIIVTFCTKKVKFFNDLLSAAIDFIYRMCATPIKVVEPLIKTIVSKFVDEYQSGNVESHIIIRLNTLLGLVAIKHLYFLDEVVYKELKRRNIIREERKNEKNKTVLNDSIAKTTKRRKPNRNDTTLQDSINMMAEDSILEGAQADDIDSDTISRVLETCTVTENSGLGCMLPVILSVCENPEYYNDEYVQCSAITALLRYMLVSNNLCEKHIQLIFTILERTEYEDVKVTILIHCSDLLEKCPNIIEPYTPRIYKKLEDSNVKVRKITLFMLANLILRDMIRVQGHISEMARCVVDPDEELQEMGKNFFVQLSHKANNLYNVLPDIFSHLSETSNEEQLRTIMKFLFGLIGENKQMENLVDRFCAKFRLTENENVACNITFCLSLINYNDKGLRKLIDNFPTYKHLVLNNDIYATFKQIINTCNKSAKPEMKTLATELDDKIKLMFELTEGATIPKLPKADFKKPRAKKKPAGGRRKKRQSSDDSESEDEKENSNRFSKKKSNRGGRGRRARRANSSDDSDSD